MASSLNLPVILRVVPSFSNQKLPPSLPSPAHLLPLSRISCHRRFRPFASSPATVLVETGTETRTGGGMTSASELFSCPICYDPLIRKGPSGLNVATVYRSAFKCPTCQKSFSSKNIYLDLTVTSGATLYNESKPMRTELFRNPVVSFLYERGWRQNFTRSGFPGPDQEFTMAQDYFKPVAGGLLLDVSCGSGLFSRRFASSGVYSSVVALDFSENMLRQCYDFIRRDDTLSTANLALVRADISRLPFASGSVDAVHAGAALHCWPSPSNAIAEISRVLRSGGVFVATTFLSTPINSPFSNGLLRRLGQVSGLVDNSYNYYTEKEIKDLCKSCGLINYSSKVDRAFIMFSVEKP